MVADPLTTNMGAARLVVFFVSLKYPLVRRTVNAKIAPWIVAFVEM